MFLARILLFICAFYLRPLFQERNSGVKQGFRPTRCNRLDFYCKMYCPLNMFRAPLCPSSGAQELYRWLLLVVHCSLVCRSLVWCGAVGFYVSGLRTDGCCLWYMALCFTCRWSGVELQTRPSTGKPKSHVPKAATICIILEFLMMGIMVPRNMLSGQ